MEFDFFFILYIIFIKHIKKEMILLITGIIAEYNPFHKGHKYHLDSCKEQLESDGIICVMSGNFTQRGIPAIIDKWKRAEIALKNGIDLVLELPLVYSISSAEHFAFGSVSLLNSLGIVDNIYFGSESGNIEILNKIAETLVKEPAEYRNLLKENLKSGLPFHSSRSMAICKYLNSDEADKILSNSNNILGIEYIKAIKKLNSTILPKTLKREGSSYNDENLNCKFSSATSIRKHLREKCLSDLKSELTDESYEVLVDLWKSNYPFIFEENMFQYIKYKLLVNENCLKNIPDVSEGLDNKIIKQLKNSGSLNELILNSKSKRYTYTRISRILAQCFLNLENYDLLSLTKSQAPYARILGFNDKGKELIKKIKTNSGINLITKLPKNISSQHLEIDILGTKAYSVLNTKIDPMSDYLNSPIII